MLQLQDISIKRKLAAIIMVASTIALLLVSGGFVGYELITRPEAMAHHLAARAEIIGLRLGATPYGSESDRSLVTCSADNAVLNFNDSACGINTSRTRTATTAIPQAERCFEINERLFANLKFPHTSSPRGINTSKTPAATTAIPQGENAREVACVDNP